jgi:hypothetical protein
VRAAAALELGTSGLALAPDDDPDSTSEIRASIRATCEEHAALELRAEWGDKSGERSLSVSELPVAVRPRAIALALAELLAGLHAPAESAPESVELAESSSRNGDGGAPLADSTATASPSPAPAARATAARAAAPDHSSTSASLEPHAAPERDTAPERDSGRTDRARFGERAIAMSAELRSFEFQTNTAGFRAHYDFAGWGIGIATLFGHESGTLGNASALVMHAYGEKRVSLLGRADATWLTLGPRAGLGFVHVTSTANPGALDTSVSDPYLDLAGFLELSTHLGPFRLGARGELGYARGLIALEDARRLASYAGPFGGVLLDVASLL